MELERLLYSIDDVCRLLGLSRPNVMRFVDNGRLPTRRVGARIMIHRTALEKFARANHPIPGREQVER